MQQRFFPLVFVLGIACSNQTAPPSGAAGALGGVEKTWPASTPSTNDAPTPQPTSPPPATVEPTPTFSPRRLLRIIDEHTERQSQVIQKITS